MRLSRPLPVVLSALLLMASARAAGPVATTSSSPQQQLLLRQSNAAFQAIQESNLAALQALITPDMLVIASGNVADARALPDMIKSCRLKSYHLSQPAMRLLNATAAVLAYKVNQVSACGNKPDPPVIWATDVYVYRGGKWLVATHIETPAE